VTTGILVGIHVFLAIALVVCVLMHSGKDAGLSSAFGLSQTGGSTQVMERNLTRLTVAIAVLLVCTTVLLGFQTV
jgi:preprotein translocase subunit SecG